MLEEYLRNYSGQVWVETVIYTLIGISIIGILLTIATPKIEELKDKNILENSRQILNELNSKIEEVYLNPGNQRVGEIEIKKGIFSFDGLKNEIIFSMDSKYKYSESELEIKEGVIFVKTSGKEPPYKISFKINYSSVNLSIDSREILESLEASTKPYKLIILNKGNSNIDIKIQK